MTHSRIRSRRLGAILATAILTIALVPGLASAADTRLLTITMSQPTPVSVPDEGLGPYATKFEVQITNTGGQNLAHTVLTIRANAQGSTGLAYLAKYDPDGGDDASDTFCKPDGNVLTCDYSSLGAIASRTVAVVATVADTYDVGTSQAPQPTPLFTASVTTNNENGSNRQTFATDSGSFKVSAFGVNGLSTFVLNGVLGETLTTSDATGSANKLNTKIVFNTTNKELVQINEGTTGTGVNALYQCPSGLSCQNDYSEVTTTSGSFADSPFFTWTLTAIVPKTYSLSQGFVAHYPAGATTYLANTAGYWTLLFKDRSALCGADIDAKIASAHQCIKTLSLTKFDKSNNLLMVEIVMDHQGGMKY